MKVGAEFSNVAWSCLSLALSSTKALMQMYDPRHSILANFFVVVTDLQMVCVEERGVSFLMATAAEPWLVSGPHCENHHPVR